MEAQSQRAGDPAAWSPAGSEWAGVALAGVDPAALAAREGTPLYVYSEPAIQQRVQALQAALAGLDAGICYAVKANGNRALLEMLAVQGVGADIVSGGETGDTFAIDRTLPRCQAGDLVAILGAGAYGASMGSSYNSRPLPAEVMVDGGRYAVIRRRQTFEAMTADERSADDWQRT